MNHFKGKISYSNMQYAYFIAYIFIYPASIDIVVWSNRTLLEMKIIWYTNMCKYNKINYINCLIQENFGCAVAIIEARFARIMTITMHKEATCTNEMKMFFPFVAYMKLLLTTHKIIIQY